MIHGCLAKPCIIQYWNKFLRIFLKLIKLNHLGKCLQHTKYSLFGDLSTMSGILGDIMMFPVKLTDLWVLKMVKEG